MSGEVKLLNDETYFVFDSLCLSASFGKLRWWESSVRKIGSEDYRGAAELPLNRVVCPRKTKVNFSFVVGEELYRQAPWPASFKKRTSLGRSGLDEAWVAQYG